MKQRAKLNLTKPSAARSRQMSLVKATGNKSTEQKIASMLRRGKISGWRRHTSIPGRPDFAFMKERVAIFVDGCFWHGCQQCARRAPKANKTFWNQKLAENMGRDRKVRSRLRRQGWKVVRIWEHSLRSAEKATETKIRSALKN